MQGVTLRMQDLQAQPSKSIEHSTRNYSEEEFILAPCEREGSGYESEECARDLEGLAQNPVSPSLCKGKSL